MNRNNVETFASEVTVGVNDYSSVLSSAKDEYSWKVSVKSQPIDWICETLVDAIRATDYHDDITIRMEDGTRQPLTEEMMCGAFRFVLAMRINQLSKQFKPSKLDGKKVPGYGDFEYPSILGPILARYGKYRAEELCYTIIPELDVDEMQELGIIENVRDHFEIVKPPYYDGIIALLRMKQAQTNFGLPRETFTKDPIIFQIACSADKTSLIGVKHGASPGDLLVAALLQSVQALEVFGEHRVLYCAISSMKNAFAKMALLSLHKIQSGRLG